MPQLFPEPLVADTILGTPSERSAPHGASWSGLPGEQHGQVVFVPGSAAVLREVWRGAWKRRTWTRAATLRLFVALPLLALFSWLGIVLSHQSDGVATIWFSNGILFGLLITRPAREWLGYFAVGLAADTLADFVYGDPFALAVGVSLANSVEVITSALVLTSIFGRPLDLARRRPLIGFLLVSVVGAAGLCSALGARWTLLFVPAGPWWKLFRTWYLGDMLGMALLAPLVYMLQRPGFFTIFRREQIARTLAFLAIPALVTVLVFTHDGDPLTFFLFPALLLVVFRLGFPGTVVAIFVVAFLAIGLTIKGHGPLMLIPGQHALLHRIVVAQIFLAVEIFTAFPIAALLEEREILQHSLADSEQRHRVLSHSDDLTQLANRRAFNLRLEQEWQRSLLSGESLALLLLDADLFKSYNDLHGHLGGDHCLRAIADVIAGAVEGSGATAARFGGEEFAVILPAVDAVEAMAMAERIRLGVVTRAMPHAGSPAGVQTVSLGVAVLVAAPDEPVTALLLAADGALYRAKDLGRNLAVVADGRDVTERAPIG